MCSFLIRHNILNQKVIKESVIVEFLADRALEDYEAINVDFSNKDLMAVQKNKKKNP